LVSGNVDNQNPYFAIQNRNNAGTINENFRIFQSGNVTIQNGGTFTDAGFRLDVNGTARVQGELTVNTVQIGLGAGAVITNTRAGNGALITNTTGSQNTAIGYDSLRLNTTGSFNAAFGLNSLKSNTTGNENTALGRNALENNTTGASNAGGGVNALTANTTGNLNTAFGGDSLNANTTGSNNTALGFRAGRFIADGTTLNTISNNSLFIGRGTRAQADNQTNQIVIGHEVTGLGSNTTVIGNSSTTLTALYGNIRLASGMATAPASATATGTTGDVRIAADYIYVCTATNTWVRTALTTW
jgi:hypothetical protein